VFQIYFRFQIPCEACPSFRHLERFERLELFERRAISQSRFFARGPNGSG
jgi:hypothetical protein